MSFLGGLTGGFGAATVPISADLTQLRKDMAVAKGEVAKGTTASAAAARSSMARNLVAGAAVVGLAKFYSSSVKAAMEAERVAAQTAAVIKSTGGAAGVAAEDVESLSASMQALTGISDEEIQSSENLLLTFRDIKAEGGIFEEATRSIADMSVSMNKGSLAGLDLKSATIQVGKALNDPIKGMSALQRVGVSFNKQQTEQITKMQESGDLMGAQKIILGELKKEFGGAAEAAGGTLEGNIAKAANAFDDLKESVGKGIVPALAEAAKFAANIITDVTGAVKDVANELGGGNEVAEDDQFAAHVQDATKQFAKGSITLKEYQNRLTDLDGMYREASGGATAAGHAQAKLGDAVREGTISTKKASAAQGAIAKSSATAAKAAEFNAKADKLADSANRMLAAGMSKSSGAYKTAAGGAEYYTKKARGLATALDSIPDAVNTTISIVTQAANNAAASFDKGGGGAHGLEAMVNRPTLFAAGEFGHPERVTISPVDVRGSRRRSSGGGGGTATTVIHVHGNIYGKPDDFAKAVDQAFTRRAMQRAG